MNKYLIAAVVLLAGAGVAAFWFLQQERPASIPVTSEPTEAVVVVATDLEIPWDIAFVEEGMLVTERTGHVILIRPDGTRKELPIAGVSDRGEGGLLGMTLHPNFERNRYLYLYMSSPAADGTTNRVVRYVYQDESLEQDRVIIDGIPGAIYHDGGRMEFGPDGLLYVTTGDATDERIAQDLSSLGGKILRLRDDGSIPEGNPFDTAVYSYGHRNPQGLAWDDAGRLWSTEHGRSGTRSGLDEINLIQQGANYGWPIIEGDDSRERMQAPARHSGATTTWAPASAVYLNGSLYFGGLRGQALYEAVLENDRVVEVKEHFKNEFGRVRTVRLGPDSMLYITTSNRDGRAEPSAQDDVIIRVDPSTLD